MSNLSKILLFSVVAASGLMLTGTRCYPDVTYELHNLTDEVIDVGVFDGWSFNDDDRSHYASLNIGEFDFWRNCRLCGFTQGASEGITQESFPKDSVVFAARSSSTMQLLYYREFTQEELEAQEYQIEIIDMRDPDIRATEEFFAHKSATLLCINCNVIYPNGNAEDNALYYFNLKLRTYGSETPDAGEPCFDEAAYMEAEIRSLYRGGGLLVEAVPGVIDESGFQAVYMYTHSGHSLDELLIRNGVARASGPDGQHWEHLKAVEEQARAEGTGCLWQK